MRKSSKKQDKRKEINKINKLKEQLTVDVIQYNHIMQKLKTNILQSLISCNEISEKASFMNQRQLITRKRMSERVLNATLKMIDNNKLYLWMIDDQSLKEDNR